MKKHRLIFIPIIVSSLLLWLAFPDKLFTINIHATYFLFGYGTIALLVFSSYILFLVIYSIIKYITKKSYS
jgi:hypothetical protein